MALIKIKHDLPRVREAYREFGRNVADKAIARSLNRAVDRGRTAMSREIRTVYNLSAARVRDRLRVRHAYAGSRISLTAELAGTGKRAMNITGFKPKQTPQGVSVKIKRLSGRVIPIPPWAVYKPFILNVAGRPVVARTAKGKGTRSKLRGVTTIDIPQMFNARKVNDKVRAFIISEFSKELEHNLAFYGGRIK